MRVLGYVVVSNLICFGILPSTVRRRLREVNEKVKADDYNGAIMQRPWALALLLATGCTSVGHVACSSPPREPAARETYSLIRSVERAEKVFDENLFRSMRKDGRFVHEVTLDGRTELSLTPPVPSELRYLLRVPAAPILRFATGAATTGNDELPASIHFKLVVEEADGTKTEVFSDQVRRRAANAWRDHDIDLSRWAERDVTLVVATSWASDRNVIEPVLASWANPVIASSGAADDQPHLVLISIDCLRADHVGAHGYGQATTPNIDGLARDGVVFDNAFATASWTLPTHMSMLTGLLPSFHGATKWEKLPRSVSYLPERLAENGYRTAGVASWVYLSQAYGFERGFHSYRVLDDPEASDIVDAAIGEIARGEGQPQFTFVHVYDPHWPYLPPSDLMEAFGPRPRDISTLLKKTETTVQGAPSDDEEIEEVKRLYDSEIAFADRELGRLFDALKARGLYDNALIIVTADHGEAFYEHGHWQHSSTLYDELTHIPLIVKWPTGHETGRRDELASQLDIYVTLLEAAGVEVDALEEEAFLARRSLAKEVSSTGSRTLLSEVTWRSPSGSFMKVALRTAEMKYVATLRAPSLDELDAEDVTLEELYDLENDPGERDNLLPEQGTRAASFRRDLRRFLDDAQAARSLQSGDEVELDEETLRKLEAIGYTTN